MPRPHKADPVPRADLLRRPGDVDRTGRFTFPELAERLGVSVSSLYHHVKGRADIVEGIEVDGRADCPAGRRR